MIRARISVAAVGRVSQDYKQFLIVTDHEAHAVEDVGAVVLPNGLRVRDIASVTLGTEDHVRIIAGDGRPAALLNITRQPGGNTLTIADSITKAVASIASRLPPGVRLTPLYDQATLVREAVASVRDAMLIGAALAVLVLLAFLRPCADHRRERERDPAHDGDHGVRDAARGADVQPDDAWRDGDRHRIRDR